MEEIFVGIDLGTTNTLACYLKKGKPTLIKFPGSGSVLPSVVYVDEEGKLSVGEKAKTWGAVDPENVIKSSKTYMGDFKKHWQSHGMDFTPTSTAAEILRNVKAAVIKKMKCSNDAVVNAVITVPAYFNSNQTDETKKAGEMAGLNVLRIITEPMAAAIAAVKELDISKKIFVVDLGGGTFDLSVLEADQSTHSYNALDIDGDRHLGGDDFDNALFEYFKEYIEDDLGLDLSSQKASGLSYVEYHKMRGLIYREVEEAKIALSEDEEYEVEIPDLFSYNGKFYCFNLTITREEFNNICAELFKKIFQRINDFTINSDRFKKQEIEKVVLVGGSSYIPKIQEEVEKIFKMPVNLEMDRSTMVVTGACFVAEAEKGGVVFNVKDVLSHSLGIEVVGHDNGKMIFSTILHKGEVYPTSRTEDYTTVMDNQQSIDINVYEAGSDCEGRDSIEYHDFYGGFTLDGIEVAPSGVPHIDVTFSYDKSRCLTVEAADKKTGAKKVIQIKKGEKVASHKQQQPVDFMVLLDASGSMCGEPMNEAKIACNSLIKEMIDLNIHRMGLIAFENDSHIISRLTHDKASLLRKISSIDAGGGTVMQKPLRDAYFEMDGNSNEKVIVMVTDGYPFDSDESLGYARKLKTNGIRIVAIGVGSGIDLNFLTALASPDDAYQLDNMSELKNTFKEVVARVTER